MVTGDDEVFWVKRPSGCVRSSPAGFAPDAKPEFLAVHLHLKQDCYMNKGVCLTNAMKIHFLADRPERGPVVSNVEGRTATQCLKKREGIIGQLSCWPRRGNSHAETPGDIFTQPKIH
jgi:hypothetical protein